MQSIRIDIQQQQILFYLILTHFNIATSFRERESLLSATRRRMEKTELVLYTLELVAYD